MPQRVCFSLIALFYIKFYPKRCFSLLCPNSNQSLTKKGVFLNFCSFSTKKGVCLYFCFRPDQSHLQRPFFFICALILNKVLPKGVYYSFFALILTKALSPKLVSEYDQEYHNHKLQTTPWHREEEPLNHHETPGRQIKQSNQLSLPHQDDCNTRMDIK